MKTLPYIIQQNTHGQSLKPIDPSQPLYRETWLQNLLEAHPDILPVAEIEPVFYPLIPIGREVQVKAGSIDNLFISLQGYPVLVETKLWRNPEARRDVLTQAIDYAASFSDWTFDGLDEATKKYTQSIGLIDWIEQRHELETDRIYFEETVSKNLRLGRFLILVVGDRIRSSLVDLLGYINKFPHLAFNVALVELQCYHMNPEEEWPLFVVPSILARTEIVERTIVQVNVTQEGASKVTAVQVSPPKDGRRIPLTEEEFWSRLKDKAPGASEKVKKIIDHYQQKEEVRLVRRESSIAAHTFAPESGQIISLFFIRTDGVIECWHATIKDQFTKVGLDTEWVDRFVKELSPILQKRTKSLSINNQAEKVDAARFISVVDQFIENVIHAESKIE
jgi:hypothetical protein